MTTKDIIELLENALQYPKSSEFSMGWTAKEIHGACLTHIKELQSTIQKLETQRDNSTYPHLGWGKGKDE